MKYKLCFILAMVFSIKAAAQMEPGWDKIVSSAFLESQSYEVLERLCDEAGGRLMGSETNRKAISILLEELEKAGIKGKTESFRVPGWKRGADQVIMTSPTERKLQAVALGYVHKTPGFETEVYNAGFGFNDEYKDNQVKGKIALVTSERPKGKEPLLRYEVIEIAAAQGAAAVLFINDHAGTLNLAGVGNFQGTPTPIPAYSLTYEEGMWLKRLLKRDVPVKVMIDTKSECLEAESTNIIFTIPGQVKDKIVIGAHFDGWDLSQGAVDNGLGTAILFDVARILKSRDSGNYFTLEFVWFNGEEFGLWGSKRYMEMHKGEKIAAMINMDMTGKPTGFNVMGFEQFIPFMENLKDKLKGFELPGGVVNIPYTNSDHIPFMFRGIPCFSLQARLEEDMVKYYHSAGDTFDKVSRNYLSQAAAVVSLLVKELSNEKDLLKGTKTAAEMSELFKKHRLDERLKKQNEWIY